MEAWERGVQALGELKPLVCCGLFFFFMKVHSLSLEDRVIYKELRSPVGLGFYSGLQLTGSFIHMS